MDIEDTVSEPAESRNIGYVHSKFIKKKHFSETVVPIGDNIPGTQRIFVQVWGCAHNTSDAEYMAGILSAYGYTVSFGGFSTLDKPNSCGCTTNDTGCKIPDLPENHGDCECHGDCKKNPSNNSRTEADDKEAADLWLLNSCTVKGPAEDHFRNTILAAKAKGKKVVVAGCVPQGSPNVAYLKDVSVVGVQQIDRVVEVVEETLAGNVVRFMNARISSIAAAGGVGAEVERRLGGASLSLPKIRRNRLVEILAISTGCLNACTYCKTKHARGVLASYTVAELVQRLVEAFEDGVKEVWLTSEDLGAYGRDLGRSEYAEELNATPAAVRLRWPNHVTLADLLFALVPKVPPGCLLRLGMTNPPYILDQLEEVACVLRHPRVFAFLHIPVQSGSNEVLDSMKRQYTVEEFGRVTEFLRTNVSSVHGDPVTIATDLICGFPTETEADFQDTVHLVERFKFPVLFINQFFARPGTPAASMKRQATTAEVKKRTRVLHDLFRTYHPFMGREGRQYRVLITEASTDDQHWVGHTKAYEQILIPKEPELHGRIILVEVTACDKFFMRGKIVDRGPFNCIVEQYEDIRNIELVYNKSQLNNVLEVKSLFSFFSASLLIPLAILALLMSWIFTKMYTST